MDGIRIGSKIRALRLRAGDRLVDVSLRAGISRQRLSTAEKGDLSGVSVVELDRICAAVGATLEVFLRAGGTELDRLVNAGHSAMHEEIARRLVALGWEVAPEVSFSIYGERGIIDIVAWHAGSATLLVIELKTELVDVQAMVGTVDRYRRLAAEAVRSRGWVPRTVGTWVALAEGATNRRRFAAHRTMLRSAFPADGRTLAAWLAHPKGAIRALSFVDANAIRERTAARGSRMRVRKRGRRGAGAAGGGNGTGAAGGANGGSAAGGTSAAS